MKKILVLMICLFSVLLIGGCNCGSETKTYSIIFVQDGNRIIRTLNQGEYLQEADIPQPFQKKGYIVKWTITDFSNINENTTVKVSEIPKSYEVTFDSNGGNEIDFDYTATYDLPYNLPQVQREGFVFAGWEYDGNLLTSFKWNIDADNIELKAKWKFSVTFKQQGFDDQVRLFDEGEVLTSENVPEYREKNGYNVSWGDLSGITSSATVTTVETPKTFKIYFDEIAEENIPTGTTLLEENGSYYKEITYLQSFDKEELLFTPVVSGKSFDCWSGSSAIDSTPYTCYQDIHLTPKYVDDSVAEGDFTLTFRHDSTGKNATTITVNSSTIGSAIEPALPTTSGAVYRWDKQNWKDLDRDSTITAFKTENEIKVNYDAPGADIEYSYKVVKNNQYYSLDIPVSKKGFYFNGWMYNGSIIASNGTWTEDVGNLTEITVTPSWSVKVTFKYYNGEERVILVPYGGTFNKSNAPILSQEMIEFGYAWDFDNLADGALVNMYNNVVIELKQTRVTEVTFKIGTAQKISDIYWDKIENGSYIKNAKLFFTYGQQVNLPEIVTTNDRFEFCYYEYQDKKLDLKDGVWNITEKRITIIIRLAFNTPNY